MNTHKITYVDVILPLALPQCYTYIVPIDLVDFVQIGHRVIVQFGKNKFYTAIVQKIHFQAPPVTTKAIETIADEQPIVTQQQLAFWEWMAGYYLCTLGEVMAAALPASLKLSSETKIVMNEDYAGDFESLSSEEFIVVQILKNNGSTTVPDIQSALQRKNVYPILKKLFEENIIISSEELVERFKPKTESYIRLAKAYESNEAQEQAFDLLKNAPKQVALLLAFFQLKNKNKFLRKKELLTAADADTALLKRLVDKGIFEEYKIEVTRLGYFYKEEDTPPPLAEDQAIALQQIENLQQEKQVVLLHGVTSSGKTQIYLELIKKQVALGKQCLFLLPEIALTSQIINRLRKYFGNEIGVYHSKFNHNEKIEIWNKVLEDKYKVIVAARSGLFLPFKDLGLIIIDEEHDSSLKQIDPAPRYHARDAAIVLAKQFGAKVLLGTATPAIESFYNAEKNKYGLVTLDKRYGGVALPNIEIVDLKAGIKNKANKENFSPNLILAIQQALEKKEQVILFVNRRGYSQFQICKTCSYVYCCQNCDVSLTYHKHNDRLVCHYCGYKEKVEKTCKSCGAADLEIVGMGTEKIEDELNTLFPDTKIGRLDYDTTRSKFGHSEVISAFENREIEILVGTQMITKGLDFENVSLVGVINADMLLYFPGYKSFERAFDLLTQVSGRAGRRGKEGKVIIQTMKPNHPVLQYVKANDYDSFYKAEMQVRQRFSYPPLVRMIQITLKAKDAILVEKAILFLANHLRKSKILNVLGPTIPGISKVKNYYLRDILVKTNGYTSNLADWRTAVAEGIRKLREEKDFRMVIIQADVDNQ